jgi:heptosyltransferase II
VALHLPNSFESAFISFLSGIPRRAGYNTDGRGLFLTHPVKVHPEAKKKHQVDYYLDLVATLGFQPVGRIPEISLGPELKKVAQQWIDSLGFPEGTDFVGVSPGATYGSAKEWFPERFGNLADRLQQGLGAQILLLGSSGDRKVAESVCRSARDALVDLTGKTTLGEAMALISRCRLFVTNDSGLMHVAAALGVPVVAIFGSTDPLRTGPLGGMSRVLCKTVPCAPCFKAKCPEDRRCMDLISVDEVFAEAEKLWNYKGTGIGR